MTEPTLPGATPVTAMAGTSIQQTSDLHQLGDLLL